MNNYKALKAVHPDKILLFRRGDYWEAYKEDAKTLANALGTGVVDSRKFGKERWSMISIPYYKSEQTFTQLIEAGYKLALLEPIK